MNQPHLLLGRWLTAKKNAEFDVITLEGSQKVTVEKGATYCVGAVISSKSEARLVLLDFNRKNSITVPLEAGLFEYAKKDRKESSDAVYW